MTRVAITGLGIVSSIGNGPGEVTCALREGRSGMVFMPEMQALDYRCCVFAPVKGLDTSGVRLEAQRTMSEVTLHALVATLDALDDAGLRPDDMEHSCVVVGTCYGGTNELPRAEALVAAHGSASRLDAAGIARIMNATVSGNLASYLGVRGRTCSLSAACATGLYNIGHACTLIRRGVANRCICGSAEEDTWKQVGLSADNSTAMPFEYNDRPEQACRPYDRHRQGFIMSSGAGILILESFDEARRRGAPIYAEIVAFGAGNDGCDMFVPSGKGLRRSIEAAMRSAASAGVDRIDYINSHGTGTPGGDPVEIEVLRTLFGDGPLVSSTKGITGHSQGAAASQEAVYTILMLHHGFAAATANLDEVAPECSGVRHVRELCESPLTTAMIVNSGLGGTNGCLILRRA